MKKVILLFILLLIPLSSAEIIFQDDFENGLNNWNVLNGGFSESTVGASDQNIPTLGIFGGFVERNCPGNFSPCGLEGFNHYVYIFRNGDRIGSLQPQLYRSFSTEGYGNVKIKIFMQTYIESNLIYDYTDLETNDDPMLVYRVGDSGPWLNGWQWGNVGSFPFYWSETELLGMFGEPDILDNQHLIQIGFTFPSEDQFFSITDNYFIDDFQITGDPIGSVCGNNFLESGEGCELPNTNNNNFCTQSTSECSGLKTGTRDKLGLCTSSCVCENDFFQYECIKDSCGAQCDSNNDCPETSCDMLNDCYGGTYRDYQNIVNNCLSGCSCTDNSCNSYIEIITDSDRDGYDSQCDNDCNDHNPNINPSELEICDGEDNNCNGKIDEDDVCGECISDIGCGEYGNLGEFYCIGDEVRQNFEGFSCMNPATSDSQCQRNVTSELIEQCRYGCSGGECLECNDNDKDGICDDLDACPDSLEEGPVDDNGCDIFQFYSGLGCGFNCFEADFLNNEQGIKYPNDCTIVIKHQGGIPIQPVCVPTEFSLLCAG